MERQDTPLNDGFIATKLAPARWDPGGAISRAPQELANVATASLISITGSAGSGKSTLMGQFHAACVAAGRKTGWVNLEADDNNPAAFSRYFIAALAHIDASIPDRSFGIQGDDSATAFDELCTRLLSCMAAWQKPAAIFLDDFQHLTHPQIIAFFDRMVLHLPATTQMFIASRHRLPLQLARARVSGRLVELDQHALNFNPTETTELLRHVHGLDIGTDDVNTLWQATEGWVAGLQLAAIALQRRHGAIHDFICSFSGRDKDLTRYLSETVLNAQPDAVREFLLHTAPLHRMCADLCGAATGVPQPAALLQQLERNRLFLIPLDRNGEWFRYHHLFGAFLRDRLRTREPQMFETICDRAERWCLDNGFTTQAIQYALDAGHFEHAAELIADRCLAVAQSDGDLYTILDWMRRLPPSYHLRQPQITLSHAWARAFSHDPQQAIDLADQVLKRLPDSAALGWPTGVSRRRAAEDFALAIQAVARANLDDTAHCMASSQALLQRVDASEAFILATAGNCVSYANFAVRALDVAMNTAAEAYRQSQRAASPYAAVWADFLYAAAAIERGQLTVAQQHAERAEINTASAGLMKNYSGCLATLLKAEIACQRGDFEHAAEHMQRGRSFAAVFGPLEALLIAYRTDARICAWTGNLTDALRILSDGRDVALRRGHARLYIHLAIEEISLRLLAGQATEALEKISELGVELNPAPQASSAFGSRSSTLFLLRMLGARIALAAGNPRAAATLLEGLVADHEEGPGALVPLALAGLHAVALWECGAREQAVDTLCRAMTAATPENCLYVLASCGDALRPIIDALDAARSTAMDEMPETIQEFIAQLVAMLDRRRNPSAAHTARERPTTSSVPPPHVSLTGREIELLKLVSDGLPNKELARAANVSETTVKWHLHNINEKLGANNRTAAVAKAREWSLI
ncbi:MAG: hypothetical protein EPN72_00930 [Nevskiaceae bacterium]|nr:MAG: hypothetical protein EPN63_11680 [Nevskiaceae bacterium]TBR74622.1 MAG: hypothetical protein EPN72_00930 [Nevskiaceae bacterium]